MVTISIEKQFLDSGESIFLRQRKIWVNKKKLDEMHQILGEITKDLFSRLNTNPGSYRLKTRDEFNFQIRVNSNINFVKSCPVFTKHLIIVST